MNHMNSSSRSFSWNGNSCLFSVSPFIFHSSWGFFCSGRVVVLILESGRRAIFFSEKKEIFSPLNESNDSDSIVKGCLHV